jgi:hypothetical protein
MIWMIQVLLHVVKYPNRSAIRRQNNVLKVAPDIFEHNSNPATASNFNGPLLSSIVRQAQSVLYGFCGKVHSRTSHPHSVCITWMDREICPVPQIEYLRTNISWNEFAPLSAVHLVGSERSHWHGLCIAGSFIRRAGEKALYVQQPPTPRHVWPVLQSVPDGSKACQRSQLSQLSWGFVAFQLAEES